MKKLTIGLILLALATGFFSYLQDSRIKGALATGRLAPLPAAAHAVQVDTEGSLFARSFWVAFEAPAPDIQQWVEESPSLSRNPAGVCQRPVLSGEQPPWFGPTRIRNGLVYQIPQDKDANYGTVWIDQEANVVYIKTSHS